METVEHVLHPATREDALAHLQYSVGVKTRGVLTSAMISPMTTVPSRSPGLDTNQSGAIVDDATSVDAGIGDETHFVRHSC